MSTLRKPALGPIVGHTTHESCRLWIAAAADQADEDEDRRTVGVIGVVDDDGTVDPASICYFRLHREYDRTGTFNLGKDVSLWADPDGSDKGEPYPIKPATMYRVRLATLSLDDAIDNEVNVPSEGVALRLPAPSVWAIDLSKPNGPHAEATFRTAPPPVGRQPTRAPLSFLLGSCRYPGLLWKRKHSDRIFAPMLKDHSDVDFALMVGDQIYADMFNRSIPIGLADTYEEFHERYHSAFGSPNMRALLRRIPTYMILDDHEIEDNWTQDRINGGKRVLFNVAIGAYMSYQWSHGPRFADSYVQNRVMKQAAERFLQRQDTLQLFYDFSWADYPFFVLDTRTHRFQEDNPGLDDNHLLGKPSLHPAEPSQLDRLCAWLRHMQQDRGNTPKFIVSSSVFVPNSVDTLLDEKHKNDSDSWPAFPRTRAAVLETLVTHQVQNVVFLSGDIHCANIARMTFSGPGQDLVTHSITSSAFYWPFPFADGDPAGYVHDSKAKRTQDGFKLPDKLGTMHYTAWGFTQADNFARIAVDAATHQLVVRLFDSDGTPLLTRKQNDAINTEPERIALAKW